MKRKRIVISVEPGTIVRELSKAEVYEAVNTWLVHFGQDRFGVNTNAYLWHVFSYGRFPSQSGVKALEDYGRHDAVEYIVISNDRDQGFITDLRPTSCPFRDWLVFPANFAWTMAFTHEDGFLGPYFAKGPLYERLNAENMQVLRKSTQAARAKSKGW